MSKTEDVINRAYGHIAREVTPNFGSEINVFRGFKYHWHMFIRKFTR